MIILVFLALISLWLFFVVNESSPAKKAKKGNAHVDWTIIFGEDDEE